MGVKEVEAFLTHLAVKSHVAASTQNQALSALLFLYREVLEQELPALGEVVRAKRPQRLPVVFTQEEVRAVLAQMEGVHALMAELLYGSGLRLLECLRLRVKDVDFGASQIVVRDGKGGKDRVTVLPASLIADLTAHLRRVEQLPHLPPLVRHPPAGERLRYPHSAGAVRCTRSVQRHCWATRMCVRR